MDERFVFLLETEVHTFGRKFDSQAPTAKKLFTDLKSLCDNKSVPTRIYGNSEVSISEVITKGDFFVVLFRLADDKIPDNRFQNKKTKTLRDAPRKIDEAPAVSAHFVINAHEKFDIRRAYPTAIENADHVSKSIMLTMLNSVFKQFMNTTKKFTHQSGKIEVKPFIPRVSYQADYKNTIDGILSRNGSLIGIEYTDETVEQVVLGSKASTVRQKKAIKLIPEKRPRGDEARNFITEIFSRSAAQSAKTAKITIEDPDHGKLKVVNVTKKRSDALKSAFVPQKFVKNISPPLQACEDKVHMGFVSQMMKWL